jgi:hypothetical protein
LDCENCEVGITNGTASADFYPAEAVEGDGERGYGVGDYVPDDHDLGWVGGNELGGHGAGSV